MSEIKVNKISPRAACGTTTLGDSGDTFTIPAGVSITNNGTASGFGATGSASWNTTVKTGDFTAVAGEGYFVNTTSGAITVTLPASPSAGAVVAVKDYANTFDTNACTLGRNGSNIGGLAIDSIIQTEGLAFTLIYVDATKGWLVTDSGLQSEVPGELYVTATGGTITTCGNFKIHTFTGPGTFCVSCAGNSAGSNEVSYLVVAGGAGGGSGNGNAGGGGGAGGYREAKSPTTPYTASPLDGYSTPANRVTISASSFPITVGAGGAGLGPVPPSPGNMPYAQGNDGSNSIFSTITSAGGGGGGTTPTSSAAGRAGGSGGGAAGGTQCSAGGAGNTPPVSPSQGFPGGTKSPPSAPDVSSTGGGGALSAGQNMPFSPVLDGSNGGSGTTTSINGAATGFAGGGGGGANSAQRGNDHTWPNGRAATPGVPACNTAGFGGGEGGRYSPQVAGTAGSTNKGGGGGGAGSIATGAGGSGIVIIRYKFQ